MTHFWYSVCFGSPYAAHSGYFASHSLVAASSSGLPISAQSRLHFAISQELPPIHGSHGLGLFSDASEMHACHREKSSSVHSVEGGSSVSPVPSVPSLVPPVPPVVSPALSVVPAVVPSSVVVPCVVIPPVTLSPAVELDPSVPDEGSPVELASVLALQTQGSNVLSSWQTWAPGVAPSHQHITDAPGTHDPSPSLSPSGVELLEHATTNALRVSVLVRVCGLIGLRQYQSLGHTATYAERIP